ncbi:MAG: GntR family transcriptional regulator [Thermomicrobium sp.]|jgi:DNA-binding GntR family transcriptional regulator|uniref:GntR family transcriptional regulator n=2 Tax=Thermomicrobium sp. TaxID=1969469 RepID=UPI001B2CDB86|nr:GntR family transcriptional regulator [Thermomicrobium sp.]MBO9359374.1 GntR family transcriptional regulator [Thermomicrobium sp.]MBO9385109.1 GntR family transcriptional regulator [Thermomicrobium sp.]MBO9404871.1 GntR family transcriptional regulator [Thermomicrobium sp.]
MSQRQITRPDRSLPRPIVRRVLREEIKEYLIDAILRGQLRPGDRIIETRIAQDLGVSQTPVREALRDLELLGFVTSEPFRGTRVRAFTHEELVQIYPIRAAIEGVAARAAATRITTEQLLALEEQIDRMREASELGDEATAIEADIAFHRIIVEASGNRLLEQFWTSLSLATTTFLTFSIHRRAIEGLAARHEPILEALRARDPDRAEAAMRRHIEEPGRWVYEALSREDPEPQQSS